MPMGAPGRGHGTHLAALLRVPAPVPGLAVLALRARGMRGADALSGLRVTAVLSVGAITGWNREASLPMGCTALQGEV